MTLEGKVNAVQVKWEVNQNLNCNDLSRRKGAMSAMLGLTKQLQKWRIRRTVQVETANKKKNKGATAV
jgi:hypothetical protein